ncbi:MAG: hypothetical protein IJZ83_05535 [Clostridia bacterium]|nr:hypothetical protein [Clostridia bacterium]
MMKTMKPGSQLYRLMCLLSVAGEYPVKSLHLLGNKRMYRKLVKDGLSPLTVKNSETGETLSLPRLFNLCGRGKTKTIRLYAGALPILTWFGEGEYYESITHGYSLPMNASHLDRNHRVGEALAVCMDAGIEILPHNLPKLKIGRRAHLIAPGTPFFLTSRAIKQIGGEDSEANKTNFTRMVGGLFAGNDCYCVFNTRDSVMKWSGEGEMKARINLEFIYEANAAYSVDRIRSAIIFGASPEIAMGSIESTKKIKRMEYRFYSQFWNIHYIPLNEYGARLLNIFTIVMWKEKLLRMLFNNNARSFGYGIFDYDAMIESEKGKKFVLSLIDCDLARLKRFKEALQAYPNTLGEVLCYDWMAKFVQDYMKGTNSSILCLSLDRVEQILLGY